MKIGILTYHRSHNYGALLQAIALRKVLADMGNDVTFIDYWPKYHQHTYAFFSLAAMRSGVKKIIIPEGNKRNANELPKEIKDHLKIIYMKNVDDAYKEIFN